MTKIKTMKRLLTLIFLLSLSASFAGAPWLATTNCPYPCGAAWNSFPIITSGYITNADYLIIGSQNQPYKASIATLRVIFGGAVGPTGATGLTGATGPSGLSNDTIDEWSLTGNAGTDGNFNYLGTSDFEDFIIGNPNGHASHIGVDSNIYLFAHQYKFNSIYTGNELFDISSYSNSVSSTVLFNVTNGINISGVTNSGYSLISDVSGNGTWQYYDTNTLATKAFVENSTLSGATGATGATGPSKTVTSARYFPTATGTANISSVSVTRAYYYQVDSMVTVFFQFTAATTLAVNTTTTFDVTLPVSSTLTDANDLSGSFSALTGLPMAAGAQGNTGNNKATISFGAAVATSTQWSGLFSYIVH